MWKNCIHLALFFTPTGAKGLSGRRDHTRRPPQLAQQQPRLGRSLFIAVDDDDAGVDDSDDVDADVDDVEEAEAEIGGGEVASDVTAVAFVAVFSFISDWLNGSVASAPAEHQHLTQHGEEPSGGVITTQAGQGLVDGETVVDDDDDGDGEHGNDSASG